MSYNTANIFNIQKFSLHDGPGIRTTVFFKGCPMRCLWCSNPESQSTKTEILRDYDCCIHCGLCNSSKEIEIESCPVGALSLAGTTYTVAEVLETCLKDKMFYEESGGGVTLGGGEMMLYSNFAVELLRELKANDIHRTIETAGHISTEIFRTVIKHVDLILYDIKHYQSNAHLEGTGVDNQLILENLTAVFEENKELIVRIPIIPCYNDSLNDAQGFADLFIQLGVKTVQLLPFHNFGENKYKMLNKNYNYVNKKNMHPEDLEAFLEIINLAGINCFF